MSDLIRLIFVGVIFCVFVELAPAQLRIVTYNTATSGEHSAPSFPRSGMATVLQGIGDQIVEGIARPIDVLLLQEQQLPSTTTQAIVEILNELHGEGTYARGEVAPRSNGGGRPAIVYNTQTVELVDEVPVGTTSVNAASRQTMRYELRPIGYGESATLYAYNSHYKAGSTATDQDRRNAEARSIRGDANRLSADANMIMAGDFNIRSCDEAMFQTLTAPGSSQVFDPVNLAHTNCNWNNRSSLRRWHTQSPADGSDGTLVTGGMDDRFDFQMVTDDLLDGEGLSVIPDTYRTFGNNGSHHLNDAVNASRNTAASRPILNALARTSDHLPVVVDYQLPAISEVQFAVPPTTVIQNASLTLDTLVANVAPVSTTNGADELDFALSLEVGVPGNPSVVEGSVLATESQLISLPLPTENLGSSIYRAGFTSDSRSVVGENEATSGFYTVMAPASPEILVDGVVVDEPIDLGFIRFGDELPVIMSELSNRGDLQTAALDLSEIRLESNIAVETDLASFAGLQPGQSVPFELSLDAATPQSFESTLRLSVSDDRSIYGATTTELSLTLVGHVAFPGDANGDNEVSFDDFLVVSRNFDAEDATWNTGDFNGDGAVGFDDFLDLSRNFGNRVAVTSVPEPATRGMLAVALILFAARRRNYL